MRKFEKGDQAKIVAVDPGGWDSLIGKSGVVIDATPNKDGKIQLDFENGWIGWHKPENLILDITIDSLKTAIQILEDRSRLSNTDTVELEKYHVSNLLKILHNATY